MTKSRRRIAASLSLALAAGVAGAAVTGAQEPVAPSTLSITLPGGKAAPVVDATTVRPGATEVVASSPTRGGRAFLLARLKPGTTAEQFRKMTESKRLSERTIDRLGKTLSSFVAQGSASKDRGYSTVLDLQPGTYVALDITNDKRQPQVAFEVAGERSAAPLPEAGATVEMRDFKWSKTKDVLPAQGTLRVRNAGKQLHFLLAMPASSSKNASRLEKLLRSRSRSAERRAERLIAGPPAEPVGLISPGVENRVQVDLKKGHYVLVCFYSSPASKNRQHNQLGMARKVRFG